MLNTLFLTLARYDICYNLLTSTVAQESIIYNTSVLTCTIIYISTFIRNIPQLKYQISDCRCMPEFQDSSFDCLLDKGTLDAMLCGQGCDVNSLLYLSECFRYM